MSNSSFRHALFSYERERIQNANDVSNAETKRKTTQEDTLARIDALTDFSADWQEISDRLKHLFFPKKTAKGILEKLKSIHQKACATRPAGWHHIADNTQQQKWLSEDSLYTDTISGLIPSLSADVLYPEMTQVMRYYADSRITPAMQRAYLNTIKALNPTKEQTAALINTLHKYIDFNVHRRLSIEVITQLTPRIQTWPEAEKALAARQLISLFKGLNSRRTGPINTQTLITTMEILLPYSTPADSELTALY